ncbi:N-myc-interactor [Mastacembelus armatus]|uniref:N-myc (and STAT) interactor n=1 Tax=Mastacembelus armatus TaxID=205130 RepID=A0A3Q3LEY8_9TELE|nr:N-myc-interactor [Mastacembelus armatus]
MSDYANQPMNDTMESGLEDSGFEEAKKELQSWKTKTEKADDVKSRLIAEKSEEDETKEKAKQEMLVWAKKHEDCQKKFTQDMGTLQDEITVLAKRKQDLLDKLSRCQAELEAKRAESNKLKQKFKIYGQIPDTEVKFSAQDKEEDDDDSQPIRGVFTITQRATVLLLGGQALITFEEEKVASQILKIAKCSVPCENSYLDVKPKRITMDPTVTFEVHLDVSRKELKVSNVPPSMPEERMQDRLDMSFSRPSRGGGEVERVDYDKNTGTGHISFLHPGVAESLALQGRYCVNLDSEVNVQVGFIYKYQLRKFQTFCGNPKRTILLDEIKDIEDEEDLQDHLEIHFQKPCTCGGEIESIRYISGRKALQALFHEDTVESDI